MTDLIGPTTAYTGHEAPNESRLFAGRLDHATPDETQADDEPKDDQ